MWTERKLGRFSLTEEALMPPTDSLWMIFRDISIISAQWNTAYGRVDYFAWGRSFRELAPGEEVPVYVPSVVSTTRNQRMVEWSGSTNRRGRKEK